jgi:hypothetical protein
MKALSIYSLIAQYLEYFTGFHYAHSKERGLYNNSNIRFFIQITTGPALVIRSHDNICVTLHALDNIEENDKTLPEFFPTRVLPQEESLTLSHRPNHINVYDDKDTLKMAHKDYPIDKRQPALSQVNRPSHQRSGTGRGAFSLPRFTLSACLIAPPHRLSYTQPLDRMLHDAP